MGIPSPCSWVTKKSGTLPCREHSRPLLHQQDATCPCRVCRVRPRAADIEKDPRNSSRSRNRRRKNYGMPSGRRSDSAPVFLSVSEEYEYGVLAKGRNFVINFIAFFCQSCYDINNRATRKRGAGMNDSELIRFEFSITGGSENSRSHRAEELHQPLRAIRDLIRDRLPRRSFRIDGSARRGVNYAHLRSPHREISDRLTDIAHDHHEVIVSSVHVHLTHNSCMEVVIVRGCGKDFGRSPTGW
jgi:CopG family nickel-responsive transcriptional regulator